MSTILSKLSPRCKTAALLLKSGKNTLETATAMHVTQNTVKAYYSRMLILTQCRNRTELAIALMREDINELCDALKVIEISIPNDASRSAIDCKLIAKEALSRL